MQRNQELVNLYELIKKEEKTFADEDYCFSTGKSILKLTGLDTSEPFDKFKVEYKHFLADPDSKELYNEEKYLEFLNKESNAHYFDNLFKKDLFIKLFTASKEPQHHLYEFRVKFKIHSPSHKKNNKSFYKSHNFFIEKVSNDDKTGWYIYHSWINYFTLLEWLGINSWQLDLPNVTPKFGDFFNELFKDFGGGRIFNDEEVKTFIRTIITAILKNSASREHYRYLRQPPEFQFTPHFMSIAAYDMARPALTNKQAIIQSEAEPSNKEPDKKRSFASSSNISGSRMYKPKSSLPANNIDSDTCRSSCLLS